MLAKICSFKQKKKKKLVLATNYDDDLHHLEDCRSEHTENSDEQESTLSPKFDSEINNVMGQAKRNV